MAKDPAFLFYSQDFYTGVATMSFEDRGKYISILCLMHQQGRMKEETIRFLVGSISDMLKSKFSVDDKGFWFNDRLESEIQKRAEFTESRRNNGSKGGRPKASAKPNGYPSGKPKGNHMENEDVNEIGNELKNKKEPIPKVEVVEPDFTKPDIRGDEIIFPYDTAPMRQLWAAWKESRWKNWDEEVYGMYGEQAELKKLNGLNYQQIEHAIGEAISGGWKNLHVKNGPGQTNNGFNGKPRKESGDDLKRAFAERHGAKPPGGQV